MSIFWHSRIEKLPIPYIADNPIFAPETVIFLKHTKIQTMRKADVVSNIADKSGVAKVDVLVAVEAFFKEVKDALTAGEHVYVRGFGSFILKKRAAKIGRNIKKGVAVEIPEHFIPAFKPAKEFMVAVKEAKLEGKIRTKKDAAEMAEMD